MSAALFQVRAAVLSGRALVVAQFRVIPLGPGSQQTGCCPGLWHILVSNSLAVQQALHKEKGRWGGGIGNGLVQREGKDTGGKGKTMKYLTDFFFTKGIDRTPMS